MRWRCRLPPPRRAVVSGRWSDDGAIALCVVRSSQAYHDAAMLLYAVYQLEFGLHAFAPVRQIHFVIDASGATKANVSVGFAKQAMRLLEVRVCVPCLVSRGIVLCARVLTVRVGGRCGFKPGSKGRRSVVGRCLHASLLFSFPRS